MKKDAGLSECKRYRYWLTRQWDSTLGFVAFIMLNPSKADAEKDDPTVRKCCAFARRWGFGGIYVVNLFAYRSTYPEDLLVPPNPVGPCNDDYLRALTGYEGPVVAAWGAAVLNLPSKRLISRAVRVRELLGDRKLKCLGLTDTGQPRHPLWTPLDTNLIDLK